MCVIVDNDIAHKFFSSPVSPQFAPVRHWITRQSGRLVVGGLNMAELSSMVAAKQFTRQWKIAGIAVEIVAEDIAAATGSWVNLMTSNDVHVIALARASGARLLCTGETTGGLASDFTNKELIDEPRGKVYRNAKTHRRLLGHSGSFGIDATGVWKK